MQNLHNNKDKFIRTLIEVIKGRYKVINARQERQRCSTMGGQVIMNNARMSSKNDQTLRRIKSRMATRGGGEDGLSETKGKYDGTKEVGEEEDSNRANRWHAKQITTDKRNHKRRDNKERK